MSHFKKKLKIGNIDVDFPFFLAPMAGVTDYAFRVIAKEFGAAIVYSEFVSAHGYVGSWLAVVFERCQDWC